jgi:two-component system heavy metal sensor histidine kinase CusS
MRRPLSIRLRLSLWYAAVLLAGFVLFSLLLWFAVRQGLIASVDHALDRRVQGAFELIEETSREGGGIPAIQDELGEYADSVPEGRLIRVTGPNGQLIFPIGAPAPLPTRGYRVLRRSASVFGRPYTITAAASLENTEDLLARLRWLMFLSIPITLAAAALGGYAISRQALSPVDSMTSEAAAIGIGNLSRRLAVPRTGDELERLASTWNHMLDRLESAVRQLTQFTADASHELRTPVALIRTTAELALRRPRTPEDYREALRQIVEESERTSRLVDDLLTLARADAGRTFLPAEPLDLTLLVRDVSQQAMILGAARRVEVHTETPIKPVTIQGNPPALRRLLFILLDNAIKYTPEDGTVTVSLRNDASPVLSVADTGIGIPPDALPHVFERFFRADPSRNRDFGGAGLGLAIARWIAERHNATITAESTPGLGSTFRVTFPAIVKSESS